MLGSSSPLYVYQRGESPFWGTIAELAAHAGTGAGAEHRPRMTARDHERDTEGAE